ncbi:hypothetical protein HQ487_00275 [Candidatus Uhrbacteria bacterium]|nr:hypothetical protein [Candidatus Uhrbacteria bacterium]
MGSKNSKKESNFSVAMVVAIVLIASTFLFLRPAPEEVKARSEDGIVSLEGVTSESGVIVIERLDGVTTDIEHAVSPVYELAFTQRGILQEGELTFEFDQFTEEGLMIQDVVVYQFDRSTLSWEALPTSFVLETQTLFAPVSFAGNLLVGLGERVLVE